jgi:hypothetical protein
MRNSKDNVLQNRKFLSLSQCGFRDGQPLVCCRPNKNKTPTTNTATVQVIQRNTLLPTPGSGQCGIDFAERIYGTFRLLK